MFKGKTVMGMNRKILLLACGIIAALFFSYILLENPFSVVNGFRSHDFYDFYLEGTSVFWGEDRVYQDPMREEHTGDDYRIERTDRTYIRTNGTYYIQEGDELYVLDAPEEEMPPVIDMFNRKSVIANYQFSDLEFDARYSTEIPSLPSGEMIPAVCEAYSLKSAPGEEESALRLYFVDHEVFAVRSYADDRFIFYVDAFERLP